jgi:molecular chaperone DnaK
MVKDAEQHAEDDRKRRVEAEARNQADTLVYQTEKILKESADKIQPADKTAVEGALQTLRDALGGTDVDAITSAISNLQTASQTMGQHMYEAAGAGATSPGGTSAGTSSDGGSSGSSSEDEVVDAEIVDEGTGTEDA